MNQPVQLDETINQCIQIVRQNQFGHLDLGYRQQIWASLGERLDRSRPWGGAGHYRRTVLDMLAVQHVLPLWIALWSEDHAPQETLELAQSVLRTEINDDVIAQKLRNLWAYSNDLDQLFSKTHPFELAVFLAAMKVVDRAWHDWDFDPRGIDLAAHDGYAGYHDTDAALDASTAYASGWPWQPSSDAAKRREFWEWWLREAVPAAWASYPPAE